MMLNSQGDVIRMLDSTGTTVASYEYDPFGNIITATGIMAEANPLRYRGYYYDRETGFYYLNSRYYDPKIGRFINADSTISDVGEDIRGYNMYVYCFNNPVNMLDLEGNWPRWISAAVSVVATGVAIAAASVAAVTVAATAATVAIVAGGVCLAQTIHYDVRQSKNINLPSSPQQAADAGWKKRSDF